MSESESVRIPINDDSPPDEPSRPQVDEAAITPAVTEAFAQGTDILDVRAIEADRAILPPFYREGFSNFMKRAQHVDPAHFHHWVNVNRHNQHLKKWKGWEPVEDKETLKKLGLDTLLNSKNRAQHMDVELWRMPVAVGLAIRRAIARQGAERSESLKQGLEAMAEDTRGRSKGKAIPYMSTTQVKTDVPDRIRGQHVRTPAPKPTQ